MELWAIVPELILAALVLVLLPLGSFLPTRWKPATSALALLGLVAAGIASARMLGWDAQPVFMDTYAIDPFAVFFKLLALAATAVTLLATVSRFRGNPHEGTVPALLVLTCLGMVGLAASQDLALIALFIQIVTVGSYTLVAIAKDERHATEGALKLFLFSAASSAVMLYGMALLYGLTGSVRLPEMAARLDAAPVYAVLATFGLILVGYGYEPTIVPFHAWAPDTYQGARTPIAGFLAVGPKAAGLAVILRTLVVALPDGHGDWPVIVAILAAVTMTVGNVFALLQRSAKRLLAYSSVAQAGYLLVGVAAAGSDALAVSGLLLYLIVYLFMNLGAFLAVDAIERLVGTDDIEAFGGLIRVMPAAGLALTLAVLSLAGIPPLGGFVGKTMLFGAALGVGWTWLAVTMALNVVLSLFYYLRLLQPMYFRPRVAAADARIAGGLRLALVLLSIGTVVTGVLPGPWVDLAEQSATLLAAGPLAGR